MYLAAGALSVLQWGVRFYLLFPQSHLSPPNFIEGLPHAKVGLVYEPFHYRLSSPLAPVKNSHGYQPGLEYSFKEPGQYLGQISLTIEWRG